MTDDDRRESFLARWSRRKEAPPEVREREDVRVAEESGVAPATAPALPDRTPEGLPPVESLTPDSDFTRFMRPDVPPAARNAAVKKLFADPHFNVMDGLDTYIDDYTRPDPIPLAMLKELAQSKMLGLFADEVQEGAPAASGEAALAQGAQQAPEREALGAAGAQAPPAGEPVPGAGDPAGTPRATAPPDAPARD